jgi:GntR family transcriptional regulator, vanillate catabolism transcriptional regulator
MAETVQGGDKAQSQAVRAQIELRKLVLSGELAPGERVSELPLVDRLGVSRTPVRLALVKLEEEGLLEAIPSGGFAVRAFSERDAMEAVEIRGTMEGLAARFAAERGAPRDLLARAATCLDAIDAVLERPAAEAMDLSRYVALNAEFHELVAEMAGSDTLIRQVQRASALPFASPSALVSLQAHAVGGRMLLTIAQDHHRCILAAIERREGTRAEALMREHARIAHRNLESAFLNQRMMAFVPGAALIRRRAPRSAAARDEATPVP